MRPGRAERRGPRGDLADRPDLNRRGRQLRDRLALVAILGGSLTFLVSLYFTWIVQHRAGCASASGVTAMLCRFDAVRQSNGWGFFGQAAAVAAIVLAGAALAALVRPHLASRLPLGRGALALGVFALLSVANLWQMQYGAPSWTAGLAPAAYLGLAAAAVVGAAVAVVRLGDGAQLPSPVTAVGQLLSLGVIASFLLPAFNRQEAAFWFRPEGGLFICAFACLGVWAWSQGGTHVLRLAVSAAIAALVAPYLPQSVDAHLPYELWLLIACSSALLVLSLSTGRGLRPHRPAPGDMAVVGAGVLLLVSLFLPWQAGCSAGCGSQSGWAESSFAGPCVLFFLVAFVSLRRFLSEFAIGAAIFVAATFGANLQYGALIGFAATALLLIFALPHLLPIPGRQFLVRLIPGLAALGVLAFDVAPLGGTRLPQFAAQSPWISLGLLAAIATVVTIRLLVRWCAKPRDSGEVVLLPLGLLALTALDFIYVGPHRLVYFNDTSIGGGISWQGWVSLCLCLLLLACGWVARYGGGLAGVRRPATARRGLTEAPR